MKRVVTTRHGATKTADRSRSNGEQRRPKFGHPTGPVDTDNHERRQQGRPQRLDFARDMRGDGSPWLDPTDGQRPDGRGEADREVAGEEAAEHRTRHAEGSGQHLGDLDLFAVRPAERFGKMAKDEQSRHGFPNWLSRY